MSLQAGFAFFWSSVKNAGIACVISSVMKDCCTLDLFEDDSPQDLELVAGIDEAGRGPLAGPVFAAAVILDPKKPIEGLRDSKKLTPKERSTLEPIIKERALAWAVAFSTVEEIDQMNILQATLLAMKRAVLSLKIKPTLLLIDGNRMPQMPFRMRTIVKGDDKVPEISAASILAKTAHDRLFETYAIKYPGYGFESHMGYGTHVHVEAIELRGILPIHRKTFEPIASILKAKEKG